MKLIPGLVLLQSGINLVLAFDLCILFNNCPKKQENNNRRARQRSPSSLQFIYREWNRPPGSRSEFHIPINSRGMNWFEAYDYCHEKGGYLAEPKTREEMIFLEKLARAPNRGQYWIGLRGAEDCRCTGADDSTFDAPLYRFGLKRNEPLGTSCPQGFQKSCGGHTWRFAYSEERIRESDWNRATREPNGNWNENCVAMWGTEGLRWSDWHCSTRTDKNLPFIPICQREFPGSSATTASTLAPFREPRQVGPDDNPSVNAQCLDRSQIYLANKRIESEKIKGVGTYQECQRQCLRRSWCQYWSLSLKKGKFCRLYADLRRRGFRRQDDLAVSGSLARSECKNGLSADLAGASRPRQENYCVEYGMRYVGGLNLAVVGSIPTADGCKQVCEGYNGCSEWSYNTIKKGCALIGPSSSGKRLLRRSRFISGSVRDHCQGVSLSKMLSCECVLHRNRGGGSASNINLGELITGGEDDDDDYDDDYQDLAGSGLIDVRLLTSDGKSVEMIECQKREVRRCAIGDSDKGNLQMGKEACVDFSVSYQGGRRTSIYDFQSADQCRSRCLYDNAGCKFWSWNRGISTFPCELISDTLEVKKVWSPSVTSGSILGNCSTLAISQLSQCQCVSFDATGNMVQSNPGGNTRGVDTRIVSRPRSGTVVSSCNADQGTTCYAGGATPDQRSDSLEYPPGISGRLG